jgi:DNA-binding NtrC family response regulator
VCAVTLYASTVTLHACSAALHASTVTLHASIVALHASIVALHASIVALHASIVALHASTVALHACIVALHASTAALHASIVALHASIVALHACTVALHAGTVALHASIVALHACIVALHACIVALHACIVALHASITTLHASITTLHASITTLHACTVTLHACTAALHASITTLHACIVALHASTVTLHACIVALHACTVALHANITTLHASTVTLHANTVIGPPSGVARPPSPAAPRRRGAIAPAPRMPKISRRNLAPSCRTPRPHRKLSGRGPTSMTDSSPVVVFPEPAVTAYLIHLSWFPNTNPFTPIWAERERALVPASYLHADRTPDDAIALISVHIQRDVGAAAARLGDGRLGSAEEMAVYRGAAIYALWDRYRAEIQVIIDKDGVDVPFMDAFVADYQRLHLDVPVLRVPPPGLLLAVMYQSRRNVFHIARKIRGRSEIAGAARAAIYRANMGSDSCTYVGGLYRTMAQVPVLITGETGTGKDLAAQCVGLGRYIPLDEKERRFVMKHGAGMHARNLCEVPRDLIGSELFGHKRGSFTGAVADKSGLFSLPEAHGTLFLDEAGELPLEVQAQLLRPLENREIMPIGETSPRPIQGRHLFATHQDLEARHRAGTFREDLLERMNGVRIHMPTLREMLAEDPNELWRYVHGFLADKLDDAGQRQTWTQRVVDYVRSELDGHAWTRNVRELKHFTERYLILGGEMPKPTVIRLPAKPAGNAAPEARGAPESVAAPSSGFLGPMAKVGEISAKELEIIYVTEVYLATGQNLAETARRTRLHRRTVRALIDPVRLARRLAEREAAGGAAHRSPRDR